jgi:competence ComEA-like helix-hairpin-helix protein
MNAAPTPPAVVPPRVVAAWPRSAQLTTAFLLGAVTALLAVQGYGLLAGGARPAALEHGAFLSYRIDLNRADRAELLQLPGVGDNLAGRIEQYRRDHGAFRRVDDLVAVHGVGPATLDRLRPWVTVEARNEGGDGLPAARKQGPAAKGPNGGAKKQAAPPGGIDLNRATAAELQALPGIGPVLARRIIEERRKRLFQSVDDLRRVSGIGPKRLEQLRPYVRVGEPPLRVATVDPDAADDER